MMIVNTEDSTKEDLRKIYKSYQISQALSHPHTVQIVDISSGDNSLILVYEYCEMGNLRKYIRKLKRRLEEQTLLELFA